MTKKIIEEVIESPLNFEDCYTLQEIADMATNLIEKYGDARVLLDAGHNNISTQLMIKREETDAEYEERTRQQRLIEERERKLYEELKEKFDKKETNAQG